MPNNMKNRGLTDREMLQLCLELEKGRSRSISNTLLETSHEGLHQIYQQCFDNAIKNQTDLYEIMSSKGCYKKAQATAEQIEVVQALMKNNLHPDDKYQV